MPRQAAVRRAGQVVEVRATQIDTIGGSSDTEVNELAIALAMWNGTVWVTTAVGTSPVCLVSGATRAAMSTASRRPRTWSVRACGSP
jgi:hypothetical protein